MAENLKSTIKERERLSKLIKDENALLEKQQQGSKIYEATLARIVKLEEKKVKEVEKEISFTKKATPLYKQIEGSIAARLKKVQSLKTLDQDASSAAGELNALASKSLKSQTGLYDLIKNRVDVEGNLSKSSMEQLSTLDSIAMGTNDIAGLQNEIAQSKEREGKLRGPLMKDVKMQEKSLQKILADEIRRLEIKKEEVAEMGLIDKITGGMASKAKDFAEKLKNASPDEAAFIVATAMFATGVVLLNTLIGLGQKFAKTFDEIGKKFGSIKLLGKDLQGQLLASNIEAIKLGANIGDISSITSTLATDFGMSLDEAADLSVKVLDTSTALGLSVDEGTQLFGVLTQTANLSAGQAEKLAEGAAQLARQKGVAPQAVMKDIAGSAETIASFTKDSGANIFEAAIAARQFGLNLDTIGKSAKGMLDFESSINAEVEASVLLGKQLNLQKARELGLNKHLVGFQKEIKKQLSGIGDFNELNVIQQEALAKALNMSVPEVAKLANGTAEIGAGLGGKSFEDLLGKDAINSFTQLSTTLESVGAIIVQSVGPALGVFASMLQPLIGMIGSFVGLLDSIGVLMPVIVVGLGGLGIALTAMGIKAAISAGAVLIQTFAWIGNAVAAMTAATLGFGAPVAIAMGTLLVATVIGGMMKARSEASKVGDFKWDAATGRTETSPNMGPLLTLPNGDQFQGTKGDSAMLGKMAPPLPPPKGDSAMLGKMTPPLPPPIDDTSAMLDKMTPPQLAPNFGTQTAMEKSFSFDLPKEQTFKIIGNDLIARVEYGSTMAGDVGTGLT